MSARVRSEEQSEMLLRACCSAQRTGMYYDSLNPKTEAECIRSPHASIATLKRSGADGIESARRFLAKGILTMSKAFNRSVGLSTEQVQLTIDLIMDDPVLPNLKLDDIKLCFRRAMTGEYGECFSLDPNIILTWLKRYWHGRVLAGERLSQEEKSEEMHKPVNRDSAWYQAVKELALHMSQRRGRR